MVIRFGDILKKVPQAYGLPVGCVLRTHRGQLPQDCPAALGLLFKQRDVLGIGPRFPGCFLELPNDKRDGCERRSQLVRCSGGQSVKLGEMLLARQNQFGRRQGVGKPSGLLRDTEGVRSHEDGAADKRKPYARPIQQGKLKRRARAQGSGW